MSSGAKQTIYNLCMALLDPGDEAVIPAPYWVSYPDMVLLADGLPVMPFAGMAQGYKITPRQLAAAITPKTRLLLLNSPCNPTGAAYTRAELRALGEVLLEHPRIVIGTDDMYEKIYWEPEPFCSLVTAVPELYPRTVTINGVSKAYAMTGWRIGYCGGPKELIAAMSTIQGQSTSNASSISQKAAIVALNGDQGCVGTMNAAFKERHDFVVRALNSLPGVSCLPGAGHVLRLRRRLARHGGARLPRRQRVRGAAAERGRRRRGARLRLRRARATCACRLPAAWRRWRRRSTRIGAPADRARRRLARPRRRRAMLWSLLADALVVVHFAFTAFVIFGGFLTWRWPLDGALLHLPALAWGCWVELSVADLSADTAREPPAHAAAARPATRADSSPITSPGCSIRRV